jgi:transposase
VAKIGCKSHTMISRLKKKYKKTGKVENKPDSGHLHKLNERDECNLVKRVITRECSNAIQLQKSLKINNNIEISSNTICRALRRNSLVVQIK